MLRSFTSFRKLARRAHLRQNPSMIEPVTSRPLTYHDYYSLPEHGPRYQLIEGELHMAPAPNRFHQTVSRNLEGILLSYLKTNKIGILYDAPFDVQMTDLNVYQPDILVLKNSRRSLLTKQGLRGAPDFVVEILSPATSELDLGVKREIYARCGVEELWIIEPDARQISVYRLQENRETPAATHSENARFHSTLFPGLEFIASEIFAED